MHSLERIVALLPWCSPVCLPGTGVHCHCDHTVHVSADFSLWLDSPMCWASWYQSMYTYSQSSFSTSTWRKGGIWTCKLVVMSQERLKIEIKIKLRLSATANMFRVDWHNNDLQWPWMAVSRRIARYLCGSWTFC